MASNPSRTPCERVETQPVEPSRPVALTPWEGAVAPALCPRLRSGLPIFTAPRRAVRAFGMHGTGTPEVLS